MLEIRKTTETDLEIIASVVLDAFSEEPIVVELVRDLLADSTASPLLSLLAYREERAVGHILFSAARIEGHDGVKASILAPLSVVPSMQGQSVGTQLCEYGLELLAADGTELVFVLGYPEYYRRFGFITAGREGFAPPYPIEEKNADAWMVKALVKDRLGSSQGTVQCAAAMAKEVYWRE